jgi:hypothetical protein
VTNGLLSAGLRVASHDIDHHRSMDILKPSGFLPESWSHVVGFETMVCISPRCTSFATLLICFQGLGWPQP